MTLLASSPASRASKPISHGRNPTPLGEPACSSSRSRSSAPRVPSRWHFGRRSVSFRPNFGFAQFNLTRAHVVAAGAAWSAWPAAFLGRSDRLRSVARARRTTVRLSVSADITGLIQRQSASRAQTVNTDNTGGSSRSPVRRRRVGQITLMGTGVAVAACRSASD